MWTTCFFLSTFLMVQHVYSAIQVVQHTDSSQIMSQLENLHVTKYMLDLYDGIVDKNGNRRNNDRSMGDKIKCFLPGPSSNLSSNLLTFDIRDVKRDEEIIGAYLIVFKPHPASIKRPESFRVNVADNRDGHTADGKFIKLHGGWKSFDLIDTVNRWHQQRHKENVIHLKVKGHQNDAIFSEDDNIERTPCLLVHSQRNNKDAIRKASVAATPTAKDSKPNRVINRQNCRRKSMIVDFKDIDWSKAVIAPRKLDIHRCEGKCGVISQQTKKTKHGLLQAILAKKHIAQNGQTIKPPCCAPSEFESKTVLISRILEDQTYIAIEDIDDMVAKSCGCL